jgi:hypothetical protein
MFGELTLKTKEVDSMANAKLHINLQLGLIEVEGEEAFVTKIYEDFKSRIVTPKSTIDNTENPQVMAEQKDTGSTPKKPKPSARRQSNKSKESGNDAGPSVAQYKPAIDANLDLLTFKPYIAKYSPKNAAQQILLYAYYLREELKIAPCNLDQIYTCMKAAGNKIPTAFGQVFINTRGNSYSYIGFTNANDVTITIKGDNFVNHEMEKTKE